MKPSAVLAFALSLALSNTVSASPYAAPNPDLLPRDMSGIPEGMSSLLVRDAMAEPAVLEKRASCLSACLSSCGYCGSQGCLSNCQISCSICCSAAKGKCTKCATAYECSKKD